MPCFDPRDAECDRKAREEGGRAMALLCEACRLLIAKRVPLPEWPDGLLAWWTTHQEADARSTG